MLNIYICEDDQVQLAQLTSAVRNIVMMEEYDMKLALTTTDPNVLLAHIENEKYPLGLYILDVDLKADMNGIELAAKIREYDVSGKIIFITTHEELAHLTFQYKVEAIDYIIKDDFEKIRANVASCLKVADERHGHKNIAEDIFTVKVGSRRRSFQYDEILFFETSPTPHKVILHTQNGMLDFYYPIKKLTEIDARFVRCHKSYVVNQHKIKAVHLKERTVEMVNGETCLVSVRALGKLQK